MAVVSRYADIAHGPQARADLIDANMRAMPKVNSQCPLSIHLRPNKRLFGKNSEYT